MIDGGWKVNPRAPPSWHTSRATKKNTLRVQTQPVTANGAWAVVGYPVKAKIPPPTEREGERRRKGLLPLCGLGGTWVWKGWPEAPSWSLSSAQRRRVLFYPAARRQANFTCLHVFSYNAATLCHWSDSSPNDTRGACLHVSKPQTQPPSLWLSPTQTYAQLRQAHSSFAYQLRT